MKLNSSKAPFLLSGFSPPYVGSYMFVNFTEHFRLFKLQLGAIFRSHLQFIFLQ